MRLYGPLSNAALLFLLVLLRVPPTQSQENTTVPTFHSTTTLVFLDVTVVDKKGHVVTSGLTKDDFSISEDKRPQRIFSFEAPESHAPNKHSSDDTPDGSAATTIFVLDQLNSSLEDFAFLCDQMQKYLEDQPSHLPAPAQLMLLGNRTLELVQGYTRSRADLLFALKHVPTAIPYKNIAAFKDERFFQSIQALQQIALQNNGITGRKNIIWIGRGGPGTALALRNIYSVDKLERFAHQTTNMLVDARISLFLIFPGLKVQEISSSPGSKSSDTSTGLDPFGGDINFGGFVNETGGKLFYNENDVDELIGQSQRMGGQYYTLTYQPSEPGSPTDADGKFRRIKVTIRNPNLQVITKAGYYAPDATHPIDAEKQTILNISQAVQSSIPYTGLAMKVDSIVRHPESRTANVTLIVQSKNIHWESSEDGKSIANLIFLAVSFSSTHQILASKLQGMAFSATTQDQAALAHLSLRTSITLRVPSSTRSIRIAAQTEDGGSIGATDLNRQAIDSISVTASPIPKISPGQ
jgi:VWFA-related protein